jgi:DNA ligase-1
MNFSKTLFGLDKGGNYKFWSIDAYQNDAEPDLGAAITIRFGQEGGKLTEKTEFVKAGKQGRTVFEQAVNQAEGRIKKQMDKNYRESKEELVDLPVLPMLAKDHTKVGKDEDIAKQGVMTSDKFDGVRCIAFCHHAPGLGKYVVIKSRTGQPYSVPHIEEELLHIMSVGDILDGELYIHGPQLQDITSAVKRTDTEAKIMECLTKFSKLKNAKVPDEVKIAEAVAAVDNAYLIDELRPQLEFHIFDMVDFDLPFHTRLQELQMYSERFLPEGKVQLVKYKFAKDVDELTEHLHDAINRGYEGVMYRFFDGMYESGKRSSGLFKFKLFFDEEFYIIRTHKDKQGYVVFELMNNLNDKEFNCVMGDYAWRLSVADEDFSGKFMTVQFQARNKGTLIPQFGTGKAIREGGYVNGEFVPSM